MDVVSPSPAKFPHEIVPQHIRNILLQLSPNNRRTIFHFLLYCFMILNYILDFLYGWLDLYFSTLMFMTISTYYVLCGYKAILVFLNDNNFLLYCFMILNYILDFLCGWLDLYFSSLMFMEISTFYVLSGYKAMVVFFK